MDNRSAVNQLKQFREIIRNRYGSVVALGGMIVPFKYEYNSSFFLCSRETLLSKAQVTYMTKNKNRNG
jgi:hypothetical protein